VDPRCGRRIGGPAAVVAELTPGGAWSAAGSRRPHGSARAPRDGGRPGRRRVPAAAADPGGRGRSAVHLRRVPRTDRDEEPGRRAGARGLPDRLRWVLGQRRTLRRHGRRARRGPHAGTGDGTPARPGVRRRARVDRVARTISHGSRCCWRVHDHRVDRPELDPGVGWMHGAAPSWRRCPATCGSVSAGSRRAASNSRTTPGRTSTLRPTARGGGSTGAVGQAGRSQRAPSGGTRTTAENGRPCQGTTSACTAPMLPTPEPP